MGKKDDYLYVESQGTKAEAKPMVINCKDKPTRPSPMGGVYVPGRIVTDIFGRVLDIVAEKIDPR